MAPASRRARLTSPWGPLGIAAALLAVGQLPPGPEARKPTLLPASVPVPPSRPGCALLADIGTHDAPRLAGLALPGSGLDAYVSSFGGVSRIGRGITAVNPAFCPVLDAVAPFAAFQPNGPLRPRIEPRVLLGATVRPAPRAPAGKALRLDLFNTKGQVIHLLPASPSHPEGAWTAEAPTGPWLAVTVAAVQPFAASRPVSEPASSYLPTLTNELRDMRDAVVDAIQIDVIASAPTADPTRRPGCDAVTAMNERAQTGEELSDDEKAVLRSCRK